MLLNAFEKSNIHKLNRIIINQHKIWTWYKHLLTSPHHIGCFNRNILHQLFKYKITFVNPHRECTNSKGDFVIKKPVWNVLFKDFWHIMYIFFLNMTCILKKLGSKSRNPTFWQSFGEVLLVILNKIF